MKCIIPLLAVCLVLAGCNRPATQPTQAAADASEFAARMEASTSIIEPDMRDEALSKISHEATGAKNVQVTKRALERISRPETRDETAAACALSLAKQGQTAAATELARMIRSQEIQDKTLSIIVKGQ